MREAGLRIEHAIMVAVLAHVAALLFTAVLMPGFGLDMLDAHARHAKALATPGWALAGVWIVWALADVGNVVLAVVVALRRDAPGLLRLFAVMSMVVAASYDISLEFPHAAELVHGAEADFAAFQAAEARFLVGAAGFASLAYAPAFILLTLVLWRSRDHRPWLVCSMGLWGVFLAFGFGTLLLLPKGVGVILVANAFAFVGMMVWFGWTLERVLHERQPATPYGRWAPWRTRCAAWPLRFLGRLRLVRFVVSAFRMPRLRSDVGDVIYVNWLVPAAAARKLIPAGLDLQLVGDQAVLSMLAFRHGHFGPAGLPRLRKVFPSPVQSNWRLYVVNPRTGTRGVYFLANTCDNALVAVLGRAASDTASMHVMAKGGFMRETATATWRLAIDPAGGTGPNIRGRLHEADRKTGAWRLAFPTWSAMLEHVVPQDRSMAPRPWRNDLVREEIELRFDATKIVPLVGDVASSWLDEHVSAQKPFSFLVKDMRLTLLKEMSEPLTTTAATAP